MKKAVTLVELIIAIVLLSLILLSAVTMDIASRKFFNVSDRAAELQNEISPVLLRIKKDINQAIGDVNNEGIIIGSPGARTAIALRQDFNSSPSDYNDDTWIIYDYDPGTDKIQYYTETAANPPAWGRGGVIVSDKIYSFNLTVSSPATVGIEITARSDPSSVVGPNNPELIIKTYARAISQSSR